MPTVSRAMLPNWSSIRFSRISSRCVSVTRCPISISKNVAMVIKPSPPRYIIPKMIICPARVQYIAVSCTTSPVQVIADVDVNSATTSGVTSPVRFVNGGSKSSVPTAIMARKKYTIVRGDAINLDETLRDGAVISTDCVSGCSN